MDFVIICVCVFVRSHTHTSSSYLVPFRCACVCISERARALARARTVIAPIRFAWSVLDRTSEAQIRVAYPKRTSESHMCRGRLERAHACPGARRRAATHPSHIQSRFRRAPVPGLSGSR